MSPGQKRQAVRELRQEGLTLRAALALVQLARATYYRRRRGRWDTGRRFSSSRTLRRLASEVLRPLCLARHRYSVASVMPYFQAYQQC